jgi:hypothetical protein
MAGQETDPPFFLWSGNRAVVTQIDCFGLQLFRWKKTSLRRQNIFFTDIKQHATQRLRLAR